LLFPQKKLLLHIFIASLLYTVLGILAAFYFQELVDSVLPDGLRQTLFTLSIGVILLNVFRVLLAAFRSHLLLYLSQKLDIALLLGYYRHVLALPMNFFGTRKYIKNKRGRKKIINSLLVKSIITLPFFTTDLSL